MTANREKLIKLCGTAIFIALTVVIQLILGVIKVGPVNINFVLIPIVMAGVLFGKASGTAVGTAFGIVVFIQGIMGAEPFANMLLGVNWFGTFVAIVPRGAAIGFVGAWIYQVFKNKLLSNTKHGGYISALASSVAVPVVNTAIFLACMVIFFMPQLNDMANQAGSSAISFLFVGLAGVNFLVEVLTTVLLAPPVAKALEEARKNIKF